MLRAVIGGFLLGPVVLILVMLLWSEAGLLVAITAGVLLGAFVVAVLAGAAAGRAARRVTSLPLSSAPPTDTHDATLTTGAGPVRATARENLASPNAWRQQFQGWRYRSPPADNKP